MNRARCLVLILLALGIVIGVASAENVGDELNVDNGTMDLVTTVQGSLFKYDQSVSGTGIASINNRMATTSGPATEGLDLRHLVSGSGYYGSNSSSVVQNNVVQTESEEFESSSQSITSNDDTTAIYSYFELKLGSFNASSPISLWKDQTYTKNFPGVISMNSLFDNVKTINKETATNIYANVYKYTSISSGSSLYEGSSMNTKAMFNGTAHLGATINDVRGGLAGIGKAKADKQVLTDEDYKGSFYITKNMAVNIKTNIDLGDPERNYEDIPSETYPWLPCLCNMDWDTMAVHDQRYHSAKDFFDCTTCTQPNPCKWDIV